MGNATTFICHSLASSLPDACSKPVSLSLFDQNLRKMEEESSMEPGRDLNELQNADWVGNHTSHLYILALNESLTIKV